MFDTLSHSKQIPQVSTDVSFKTLLLNVSCEIEAVSTRVKNDQKMSDCEMTLLIFSA